MQKKQARAKIKGRTGQNTSEIAEDEDQRSTAPNHDHSSIEKENLSDRENGTLAHHVKSKDEISDYTTTYIPQDDFAEEYTSDEGWQEAVPKGRSTGNRKTGASARRPSLTKINTNALNNNGNGKYRGRSTSNFPSPRVSPNDAGTTATFSPLAKKLVKSSSFNSKASSPSYSSNGGDNSSNPNSTPASPATTPAATKPIPSTATIVSQSTRKTLSYKEVALAAPGTLVKALDDLQTKEKDTTDAGVDLAREPAELVKSPNESNGHPSEYTDKANEASTEGNILQVPKASIDAKSDNSESKKTEVSEGSTQLEIKPENISDTAVTSLEEKNSGLVGPEKSSQSLASGVSAESQTEANPPNKEVPVAPEANDSSSNEDDREVGEETQEELSSGGENEKSSPSESEKNDTSIEGAKETASKLSAAAPPFNPSTIPVFGSVAVPGFKEHGGLLPSPVNVPPMLSIPLRKHPHQSATARVPYGPRLAGGYNRSGHRGPRNKPVVPNDEAFSEANNFAPRVMNPNAAEFIPGQSWNPNGCPGSPNGPLTPLTGIPASPATPSPQVSESNQTSPEGDDISKDAASVEAESENPNTDSKNPVESKGGEVQPQQTTASEGSEDVTAQKDAPDESSMTEKPKSWADYSDGETEAVEATS